ncbi:unnamed protein product [Phaeothamnion confervicola]
MSAKGAAADWVGAYGSGSSSDDELDAAPPNRSNRRGRSASLGAVPKKRSRSRRRTSLDVAQPGSFRGKSLLKRLKGLFKPGGKKASGKSGKGDVAEALGGKATPTKAKDCYVSDSDRDMDKKGSTGVLSPGPIDDSPGASEGPAASTETSMKRTAPGRGMSWAKKTSSASGHDESNNDDDDEDDDVEMADTACGDGLAAAAAAAAAGRPGDAGGPSSCSLGSSDSSSCSGGRHTPRKRLTPPPPAPPPPPQAARRPTRAIEADVDNDSNEDATDDFEDADDEPRPVGAAPLPQLSALYGSRNDGSGSSEDEPLYSHGRPPQRLASVGGVSSSGGSSGCGAAASAQTVQQQEQRDTAKMAHLMRMNQIRRGSAHTSLLH